MDKRLQDSEPDKYFLYLFAFIILNHMHMCESLYVCMSAVPVEARRGHQISLALKLQEVVGAGTQTLVLWKNRSTLNYQANPTPFLYKYLGYFLRSMESDQHSGQTFIGSYRFRNKDG